MEDAPEIRADQAVKEVMARYPPTQKVFRAYGLDSCCGGTHTIELAARARGVALEFLVEELKRAARGLSARGSPGIRS